MCKEVYQDMAKMVDKESHGTAESAQKQFVRIKINSLLCSSRTSQAIHGAGIQKLPCWCKRTASQLSTANM